MVLLQRVKDKLGCHDTQQRGEERRESSEDMNKGAGEMDEGSREKPERDRDGWSEEFGCTGAMPRRETIHRCTQEIWERLWKNDKSRSWGRRDNEQRQRGGKSVFVWKKENRAKRETRKKKGKFIVVNLEKRREDVHREM